MKTTVLNNMVGDVFMEWNYWSARKPDTEGAPFNLNIKGIDREVYKDQKLT